MKHFGQWLKAARNEAGLSFRKLEALINGICTYSYLAQLERGDRGKKGQTYQPDRDIVIAIAKALNKPVDDARLAAGYAPKTITRKPETIPELVAALEQLGIEAPQPFGGYPKDEDGDGYREVVERIWLDIDMVTKRLTKGRDRPIIQNLELSEFDIEAETDRRKSG